MSDWMLNNYAMVMTGIVVVTIVLLMAWAKRLEKERGRIRGNVYKGGFLSAEEFQRDWISVKANGRKGTAGYKYEDGPGCYVIESFPVGTENPDFAHPNEVYVGQSLHICNRVRNHLNGKGNGDVYADVREGKTRVRPFGKMRRDPNERPRASAHRRFPRDGVVQQHARRRTAQIRRKTWAGREPER